MRQYGGMTTALKEMAANAEKCNTTLVLNFMLRGKHLIDANLSFTAVFCSFYRFSMPQQLFSFEQQLPIVWNVNLKSSPLDKHSDSQMNRQLVAFISVYCFVQLLGAPIRSSLETDDTDDQECIFKDYQKNVRVSNAFPHESRPRSVCDNEFISLRQIYENRDSFAISLDGAENPIDLMLTRVGNFKDRKFWANKNEVELLLRKSTCKNHWNELFLNWGDVKKYYHIKKSDKTGRGMQTYCTWPQELGRHSKTGQSTSVIGKNTVTKYQAFAILLRTGKIVHVGTKLCSQHYDDVKSMTDDYFPSNPNDETYDCNMEEALLFDEREQRKKILNTCTSQLGYCKLLTLGEYDSLSSISKERKIRSAKKLFLEIAGMVAPERDVSFMQEVCKVYDDKSRDQNLLNKVCSEVARQYERAADDKLTRVIAISTVVNVVSYPELRKYIPSLTEYMYRKAVKFTRNSDIPTVPKVQRYERYRKDEIIKFVQFLTSPHCLISLPFGVYHTKLSDNSVLDIPHTIRLQRHSEIIRMYNAKRKEEVENYDPLKRTTMFSICHHCYAKRSKALTCVDYYLANGYEAFEFLETVITEWQNNGVMDKIEGDVLKQRLKDGLLYLRTDFNIALKEHTPIISHCLLYALSDPKDVHFQRKCDVNNNPSHAILCERCLQLQEALQTIEVFASTQTQSCEDNDECEDMDVDDLKVHELLVRSAVFNIAEMKKHLVRTKYSELQRKTIVGSLNDATALITLDFAQKLLPTKHYESQRDYYGKKGISYHISHVLTNISGSAVEHAFVHVLDDTKQDAASIIAIIVDVLKNVSKCGITEVILRSDNAPNYHNRDVILSLQRISEITGVRIQRYAFSEPQAGKSACDRHAALVKNRVRDYVDVHGKVQDTTQFFNCLKNPVPISHTTISSSVVQTPRQAKNRKSIVGISSYYDFIPEEHGIRAWRFYGIGEGRFYEYGKYGVPQSLPRLSHENVYNPIDNDVCLADYWRTSKSRKSKKHVSPRELFECPEETCDATFESMMDLDAHLLAGVHTDRQEEIKPFRDFILRTFVDSIADFTKVADPIAAAIRDSVIEEDQLTDFSLLAEGWAHKGSRDNPKFTEDSKTFLTEMFDEGEVRKIKMTGAKAVREMRAAKTSSGARRFKAHELLRADQIASFFSRLSATRKKEAAEPSRKRQRLSEPVDETNEDEIPDDQDAEAAELMEAARNELRETQDLEIEEMFDNVYDNFEDNVDEEEL